MLEKLLSVAAANAKLAIAAAAGAALVAGGSAVAITNVADSKPSDVPRASATGVEKRSDTATAEIELPKPKKTDEDRADNHGACVSKAVAAAKATLAAGAKQGPAVSAAAKSCPKPGQGAAKSAEGKAKADAARKAAEARRAAAEQAAAEGKSRRP